MRRAARWNGADGLIMLHRISENVAAELGALKDAIAAFEEGTLDAAALAGHLASFGVDEQRRKGRYRLRLPVPGGVVTPDQLAMLAGIAERHAPASLHPAGRQEIRFHGLALDAVLPVLRALAVAGLSGGRGDVAVLAASDNDEASAILDPGSCALALARFLAAQPSGDVLPGVLSVCFAGGPSAAGQALACDLGFIAIAGQEGNGFRVHAGGSVGAGPEDTLCLHDFIPADEAGRVSEAVLRLSARFGGRCRAGWRLRLLRARLGDERFRAAYAEERLRLFAEPALAVEPLADRRIDPLPDFCFPDDPAFHSWRAECVSAQRSDGLVSVWVPALPGALPPDGMRALAAFLDPLDGSMVRIGMEEPGLILYGIPKARLGALWALIRDRFGACSSSVFEEDDPADEPLDRIEADLRDACRSFDAVRRGGTDKTGALYRTMRLAVRALLAAKGIESEDDAAAFAAFQRHFLKTGLIDPIYGGIIGRAARHGGDFLAGHGAEVAGLLESVLALYRTLDGDLCFAAEMGPEEAQIETIAADVERDYRTVQCPMNFLKVKFDLYAMNAGQRLRVILADGDPIRNVPLSVEDEGHRILDRTRIGDVWALLIEKKGD